MSPDSKRMVFSGLRIVILASICGLVLQLTKDPNADAVPITSGTAEEIVGLMIASACVGSIITLIALDFQSWLNRNK
jgi:hypothetical protein